ncbi:MAG TPA: hypothetical protein ENN99_14535 [Chloroflexi bacterium]|nr:hypothetical protein [Chloroflexota bacterium]
MENRNLASSVTISAERALHLLSQGDLELVGQILESSNAIFLARVRDPEIETLAIYKPRQGERPLWDFDFGTLCLREVAAHLVSQALGWPRIPPTTLRDGPYGLGALQLYIAADPHAHYFTLRDERRSDLLPVALFDILTNNADRKGGHLLLDPWDRIWAIDNALTFHSEPKLRTVIWDFAGQAIPAPYLADLCAVGEELTEQGMLRQSLRALLSEPEIDALEIRRAALTTSATFPTPDPTRRQIPWPVI